MGKWKMFFGRTLLLTLCCFALYFVACFYWDVVDLTIGGAALGAAKVPNAGSVWEVLATKERTIGGVSLITIFASLWAITMIFSLVLGLFVDEIFGPTNQGENSEGESSND